MSFTFLGILSASASVGFSAPVAGYSAGGSSLQIVVDKLSYPDETMSTLATGLSTGTRQMPGFANSLVAGYVPGGVTAAEGGGDSKVEKFAFPSDARSLLATGLSGGTRFNWGMANSGTAGYTQAPGTGTSSANKFAFPSDSRSVLTSVTTGTNGQAFSNNAVAGYMSDANTNFRKLNFATDAVTASAGTLAGSASEGASVSNSGVAGYFTIGARTFNKVAFPSDTLSTLTFGSFESRSASLAHSASGVAGYYTGGFLFGTGTKASSIDKITYATDTGSRIAAVLSIARSEGAGFANTGTL